MSRQLSFVLFAAFVAAVVHQVRCMPNGAPISACSSMTPGHPFPSQPSPSPFVIEPANELKDGSIEVTIRTTSGSGFKGFLLMAFDNSTTDDATPIGAFSPDAAGLSKANKCGSVQGALTHTNRSPKDKLVVTWTPADDFEGFVVFKASFVKSYNEFWVKERSPVVRVRREVASPAAPIVPLSEAPAEVVPFVPSSTTTTTTTTTQKPTTTGVPDPIAIRTPAADSTRGNAGSPVEVMALVSVMAITFGTAFLIA